MTPFQPTIKDLSSTSESSSPPLVFHETETKPRTKTEKKKKKQIQPLNFGKGENWSSVFFDCYFGNSGSVLFLPFSIRTMTISFSLKSPIIVIIIITLFQHMDCLCVVEINHIPNSRTALSMIPSEIGTVVRMWLVGMVFQLLAWVGFWLLLL